MKKKLLLVLFIFPFLLISAQSQSSNNDKIYLGLLQGAFWALIIGAFKYFTRDKNEK